MTHHSIATGPATHPVADTPGHDDDRRSPGLLGRSVAEGAGTFLVILAGLGATMLATETSIQPTLVFGFAVVAAMIAFGHVSGGHFNPAITLGSAIAGRTRWSFVVPYVLAQAIGAVAASGLVRLALGANPQLSGIGSFFGSASNGFGEHSPAQFPLTSVLLLEVIGTALLVAVFLGAGSRRARPELAPFAVGLTLAGLLSFLLPVTNGALNPVRATASALFADPCAVEQLWLFWVAPIIGGTIAGLIYRSVDAWGPAGARPAALASGAGPVEEPGAEAGASTHGADTAPRNDAASFFDAPPGQAGPPREG